MYMNPQQALAQYYRQQQPGLSPATAQPTFNNLPESRNIPPALQGMSQRFNIPMQQPQAPPQVYALAQQIQANQALQRQLGYGGAGTPQMAPQPQNVSQMMQDQMAGGTVYGPTAGAHGAFMRPPPGAYHLSMPPGQQPPAQPMQPGNPVGMAAAAPQPMAGAAQPMPQPMRQYNPGNMGLGGAGGGVNELARYYMR